jgi:homoserine O-acetyltransferase
MAHLTPARHAVRGLLALSLSVATITPVFAQPAPAPDAIAPFPAKEADFVIRDFHFRSGERLPELRIHYRTLGIPQRDAQGRIINAVMLLHGTGGNGAGFLRPIFGGVLFAPGAPLDLARYYIVIPDGIGHGGSSKPSDGLKAAFPKYDYDDMVEAQYRLLTDGLNVHGLQLILGTSMGCMHSFVWGETHPDFAKRLMPLACMPTALAGRNRMTREMMIQAVRTDPAYAGGDYRAEPVKGLVDSNYIMTLMGATPYHLLERYPTRAAADQAVLALADPANLPDANDFIWALDASRHYDPSKDLEKISARVLWINTADDFVNPPDTGLAEQFAPRLKNGRYILTPISPATVGHGSHSKAILYRDRLAAFMAS